MRRPARGSLAGGVPGVLALALSIAALACGTGEEGPRSVRLRFEYREGDTLTYVHEASGTATLPDTTDGGEPVERVFERTMEIEEVATDVTPSGHYLLTQIYRVRRDGARDSTGHPDEVRLRLEMTSQGNVIDVTGVETARSLYGDIDFQSYFEQSQPVFPQRPLKVGDSWTQEVKVVSPGSEPVVTSSTYVLESLVEEEGRELAVIAFDGDIYLPVRFTSRADSAASDGDRTTSMEQRIRVRGEIFFDHAAGVMRRVEAQVDATLSKVGFRDGEPVRREMRLKQQTTTYLVTGGR